jgi:hypothetical protein
MPPNRSLRQRRFRKLWPNQPVGQIDPNAASRHLIHHSCRAIGVIWTVPFSRGDFMSKILVGLASFGIACSICQAAPDAEPKKIVIEFFTTAFVDRKPSEAALRYVSPDKYIQHNPNGKDGRE